MSPGHIICLASNGCNVLNPANAEPTGVCCGDYYPLRFNSCRTKPKFSSFNKGSYRCDCGDYSCYCYQHTAAGPSRAFMEKDAMFKDYNPSNVQQSLGAKPDFPKTSMKNYTIQNLSYMPYYFAQRASPIRPQDNGLRFSGPLYAMSSQRHDFVPKSYSRRTPIKPISNMWNVCDYAEHCSIGL